MKLKTVRLISILLIIAMAACFVIGYLAQVEKALYYAAIGVFAVYYVFTAKFWRCPLCGKPFGLGLHKYQICPHCEKPVDYESKK